MTETRPPVLGKDKPRVCQLLLDYLALAKPRLVLMVLAVTVAGFYLGTPGALDWVVLLHLVVGTALAAGGAMALNGYMERVEDALMPRTQPRPLPDGRLQPTAALCFGLCTTLGGLAYLAYLAHILSALVVAATVVSYLFAYTPLKLRTALCSLVGAVPGALPPVAGWVAARESFGVEAWILFTILFLWQLPHSLAIALLYRDDYARAGFRLLPVVDPDGRSTGWQIVSNSLALLGVSLLPTLVGLAGAWYFVTAFVLGLLFLGFSLDVAYTRTTAAARRLFVVSLIYLPLVFLVMVFDKVVKI